MNSHELLEELAKMQEVASLRRLDIVQRFLEEAVIKEQRRCLGIAERRTSYSLPGSKDFDLGWKRCAEAIARDIRAGL